MQAKLETRVGLFVLAALGVFVYMGFRIDAFRLDRWRYSRYVMLFEDISGLDRKAPVKIAGVKVGWVDAIELKSNDPVVAQAEVMILKDYTLYQNAHAIVRQEGLLGPKYLEIVPGDPLLAAIEDGGRLLRPSQEPVSLDQLMAQFQRIAGNVEDVTRSMRGALGDVQGEEALRALFVNLSETSERLLSFSTILDRSFVRNEENLDQLLSIGGDIKSLAQQLEESTIPAIQQSMERIADVFDKDVSRAANQFSTTASSIENATIQARDGFRSLASVTEKIDEGKGLLGKLVNEDETYHDLKFAIQGLRNYFSKVETLQVIFDSHFETMHRPSQEYYFEDTKGYVDVRFHPNEDHFYLLQLATSERGWIDRWERRTNYSTNEHQAVNTDGLSEAAKVFLVYNQENECLRRNLLKIGFQFGRIYNDIAFRVGLFDGYAGAAVDFEVPLKTDNFRWLTSFEAFDFTGYNRSYQHIPEDRDRRPHFKWINRMYVFRNMYMTFGADDFISKHDMSAFMGVGLRFGDDDIKYLFSSLGGGAGIAGGGSQGACAAACGRV